MRSRILRCLAVGLLLSSGCASRAHAPLLERRFDQIGATMQHMQYYVSAHPRAPEDRQAAIAEITDYLCSRPNSLRTDFPDSRTNLQPPLRSRDFWALVLAQLQDRKLTLMAYDDAAARDHKIRALLSDVGVEQDR